MFQFGTLQDLSWTNYEHSQKVGELMLGGIADLRLGKRIQIKLLVLFLVKLKYWPKPIYIQFVKEGVIFLMRLYRQVPLETDLPLLKTFMEKGETSQNYS